MQVIVANLCRSLVCVAGGAFASGLVLTVVQAGVLAWQGRLAAEHGPELIGLGMVAAVVAGVSSLPVWVLIFAPCYLWIPLGHPLRQPWTSCFLGALAGAFLLLLGLVLLGALDNSASWLLLPFAAVTGGTAAFLATKLPRAQDRRRTL
jgi:hypothetical protein